MRHLKALYRRYYNSSWFLSRASNKEDRRLRSSLLKQFRVIDRQIDSLHEEREALVMADYLLGSKTLGAMAECGSFRGASSAKLSLVAAATGRKLYVCDSFEGLPEVEGREGSVRFTIANSGKLARQFRKGVFAARMDVVSRNIAMWGDLSVCTLVPGFFKDTLPALETDLCFIFSDADLVSSTQDVLRCLWPNLLPGGRFYSHDMNLVELVEGIMDGDFWLKEIGHTPPVLFGAGFGLGFSAGAIGFCIKSERHMLAGKMLDRRANVSNIS